MIPNPTAIGVSEEKSAPQEIARVSPYTPCRMKSTQSHRDGAARAECRSRLIDSPPFGGRVAAATTPHRNGFVPALSTRTPDRRNRLTLPPSQIAKSGRLSKKLVNHRMLAQKTASARIITSRYEWRKNPLKMQRRKMLQVSEVSKPASFTPKPETKAGLQ